MRDLERELNEWDGEWPEAWKPQEGDTLIGTIRQYSTGNTMYGECRTVIVSRDDGSRVSVWLSSTVLLSCFEREKPRVGERVGLRYLGKHPSKGYKRFFLVVDRMAQEPDFSPLGGELEPASEPDIEIPRPRTTDRAERPYAAATVSGDYDPFDE